MNQLLARWHRVLAPAVGEVGLAITRRRIRRSDLERWADVLETAAREMREAAREEQGQ